MYLVRQLESLGRDLNGRLPALNSGGCCVYAAHVAKRLHTLGVPAWGVVSMFWGSSGLDLNAIRANNRPRNVDDWNACGVHFNHVLVQFVHEGRIWTHDSNETVPEAATHENTCGGRIVKGNLTVRELAVLAGDAYSWNRCFDREEGIPEISAGVRRHLSARALARAA